jgi:hypothetical protein
VAGPGEYQVRYESILNTGARAKGEWSGPLASAETKLTVP